MSQFWHANWVEDGFRPKRLGNWEVPKWHAQWPDMHCKTTKFEAHKNGRLFSSAKRSDNPWSNFKGTWELPLKINRKTAEELSKATEFKKAFWDAHNAKNQKICQRRCQVKCDTGNKKIRSESTEKEKVMEIKNEKFDNDNQIERKNTQNILLETSVDSTHKSEKKCVIKEACLI